MLNSDTELFFPFRVIPTLHQIRGQEWDNLIDRVEDGKAEEYEKVAFSFLIVKLAGCQGCDADSFRAMKGCTQCARLVVKRFKGTDQELIDQYEQCKKDVQEYLEKRSI